MDAKIKQEIYELHVYWSQVVHYAPDQRPNDIVVLLKKKIQHLEDKLYSIKYKRIL